MHRQLLTCGAVAAAAVTSVVVLALVISSPAQSVTWTQTQAIIQLHRVRLG